MKEEMILEEKNVHFSHCYQHRLQSRAITYRFRALQGLIGTHTAINHFITANVVYNLVLQEPQSSAHYYSKAKPG